MCQTTKPNTGISSSMNTGNSEQRIFLWETIQNTQARTNLEKLFFQICPTGNRPRDFHIQSSQCKPLIHRGYQSYFSG